MAVRSSPPGVGGKTSFGATMRRALPVIVLAAVIMVFAFPRLATAGDRQAASGTKLKATTVTAHSRADTRGSSMSVRPAGARTASPRIPMKDVSIQPGGLSRAEWNSLLDLAQGAGASVIALDVNWAAYEPYRAGRPGEFSQLTSFVSDVLGRGLRLRFQLVGFPQWARDPGDPSQSSQPWWAPTSAAEVDRWSKWVTRLVAHFGSEVSYYEIWNEENTDAFWAQGASPAEYADLLEASYVAAKAADPNAVIMFGGMSRNDIGFLHATYNAADKLFPSTAVADHHFFDILGVHPYAGSDSPAAENPDWVYRDQFGEMDGNFLGFEKLHALMVQEGEGYKHIYIGEYGTSTTGWNDFPPVSAATQAKDLTLAYRLAARTGYVEGFSWYDFFTTPWNSAGFSLLKGSYPDWRPTPAYRALAKIPDS